MYSLAGDSTRLTTAFSRATCPVSFNNCSPPLPQQQCALRCPPGSPTPNPLPCQSDFCSFFEFTHLPPLPGSLPRPAVPRLALECPTLGSPLCSALAPACVVDPWTVNPWKTEPSLACFSGSCVPSLVPGAFYTLAELPRGLCLMPRAACPSLELPRLTVCKQTQRLEEETGDIQMSPPGTAPSVLLERLPEPECWHLQLQT